MTRSTPIEPSRHADGRPMLLAGLRRVHAFADAPRDVPAQWQEFHRLAPIPGQVGAAAYGAVCATWPDRQAFEYMCAVEVADLAAVPAGLGRMRVPAQRYAVFAHDGHVSTIRATWDAIWNDWLPRSGVRPADTPDFERYGERFDPATGLGGVEIWFPIRGASGG
jgi:AraC family transcriptional regulator